MTKPGRYVVYLRVSTDRQGKSGLGLEAQRETVRTFLASKGWPPLAEFVETETGKRADRPELARALAACRARGATLVVAKLDRLARNVPFLRSLTDSGVDVLFCEMPQIPAGAMGRYMLTQMASVAELEAGLVSERTKAALAVAKARGVKLGGARAGAAERAKAVAPMGTAAASEKAAARAADLAPIIQQLREGGAVSLRDLAAGLNGAGIPAARGGSWTAQQVARVLAKLEGEG